MVAMDVSRIHPQITPITQINFRTLDCYLMSKANLRNLRNLRIVFLIGNHSGLC